MWWWGGRQVLWRSFVHPTSFSTATQMCKNTEVTLTSLSRHGCQNKVWSCLIYAVVFLHGVVGLCSISKNWSQSKRTYARHLVFMSVSNKELHCKNHMCWLSGNLFRASYPEFVVNSLQLTCKVESKQALQGHTPIKKQKSYFVMSTLHTQGLIWTLNCLWQFYVSGRYFYINI